MDHHPAHPVAHPHAPSTSLARMAFSATLHCLTGCAVGEVLGMVIGTALGLSDVATIALAVVLAFLFGYAFTIVPLRRSGMSWRAAARLALAADTASIAVMELVDNSVMWFVPGAMEAPLTSPLFWGALAFALLVALLVAWPVNAWLLARGRGHALVHGHAHGTATGGDRFHQHHRHGHGHAAPSITGRDDIPRGGAELARLHDLAWARAERLRHGAAAASLRTNASPQPGGHAPRIQPR